MIIRTLACSLLLSTGAAVIAAPAPVSDVNTNSIDQRIETLERMVNARTGAQHRVQEQLDTLQDEVNELRGTLEKHNYQLENILQRQRELYLEIDKRIAAVTSASVQSAVPSQGNVSTANSVASYASLDESSLYDKAVNLILKEKKYDEAIPEFQRFLNQYPNSSFAPNAHYWLGQLLFNKQDWSGASEQFQVLIATYPDSNKRADAIFKLGVVEQKRGNVARAKQLYEQVMNEYPDSASKKLAETRLRSLN
ncbi:tol-pal system protein YbgF [Aestuariibacter sp. AA17]|uniref:Cell division coordinator CpoB n=1 Tax=Fluctibacter corallii TaxID=2984329 RepID=A0ABT3AAD1_9ALTE|nr:tol-pal system protein YbgF [Aestuariibacter sp. AA17]MCV2885542.1 tol-pal system protein YbgF [Aestuariibacter sp. AA17]